MNKGNPRYVDIYHSLKNDIIGKKYPVGTYLPTEGELEKIYSASRTTIRNAVALLRDDHLVDVRQGKGTEILPAITKNTNFQFSDVNSSAVVTNTFITGDENDISAQGATIDIVEADSRIAAALNISQCDRLYRLQRVKMIGETVFCYTVSYVPYTLVPGLEKYNGEIVLLYRFLREKYGIVYSNSKVTVAASSAGFLESKLLGVEEGTPLLVNTRIAYSQTGPFEYNESFFRSDIMQITIDFSVLPPEHI